MAITNATIKAILKDFYPKGLPLDLTYQDFPFLALIPRDESFYGDSMKMPVKYGNNPGRSASFGAAQLNSNYTKNVAFFLERAADYAIAKLTNEEMEAAEVDQGAFVRTLQHEIEGATKAAVISEAISLAEDGEGTLAQIDSGVTLGSTALQLRDPELVVRFEVGQKIQLASAKVGGTLRDSGATLTINAINRNTGLLTVSANISTISGATVNDWIVIEGDFQAKPKGFSAWIPETDPTSSPFFGVDRTADVVRLGGIRDDFSNLPIEEALVKAMKRVHREGSSADYAFLNYEKFAELENSLGSKVQYVDVMAKDVGVGFRGIKVNSGKLPVTVLADLTVPSNRLWVVQQNTWKLASLKKSIRILDQDGNKMLRVSNADSMEIRIGGYKQFGCMAPGFNGNFLI
jgi:hypothetical protein